MLPDELDDSLMQDFLTEAGELIESLDSDLVELESDPQSSPLLDSIFRALHTIKGAASFLGLSNLIEFAHAAEDALNWMRKGEVQVDQHVIDVMLKSVDVIRGQMEDIAGKREPRKGPAELIEALEAIASSRSSAGDGSTSGAKGAVGLGGDGRALASAIDLGDGTYEGPLGASATRVELPEEKREVLPYMVEDLRESLSGLHKAAAEVVDLCDRQVLHARIVDSIGSMNAVADFFGFEPLERLLRIATAAAGCLLGDDSDGVLAAAVRLSGIAVLLGHLADGIADGFLYDWETLLLEERLAGIASGKRIESSLIGDPKDVIAALAIDGISELKLEQTDGDSVAEESSQDLGVLPDGGDAAAEAEDDGGKKRVSDRVSTEQTVRVEVDRLESLMNLVGEMVLAKNQVLGLARNLGAMNLPQDTHEAIGATASDLDRLTSELQMAVMRTRMQPLNKLFGKYSRLIRDLGRMTEKNIQLSITGGDTEVDKSVLEHLADPLVHILRNSVDHGLELPEERVSAGKSPHGTIHVAAQHQGGHVCVRISDDGRGINPQVIAAKAVQRGLATQEQVDSMSDKEIFQFIFAAGFSTAERVSDLSGRGVGMDVVRTNVNKLGGDIDVESVIGRGTAIEIMIPLTVAILPAMMVGVGQGDYAIPIAAIHEIVGLKDTNNESIAKSPVMRLRDEVLPLIDLRRTLDGMAEQVQAGFAVVVQVGQERVGLIVDRLVGQREVVIKPLEDHYTACGPFSGATIREDGDVSLILDVVQVVRIHQSSCRTVTRKQEISVAAAG